MHLNCLHPLSKMFFKSFLAILFFQYFKSIFQTSDVKSFWWKFLNENPFSPDQLSNSERTNQKVRMSLLSGKKFFSTNINIKQSGIASTIPH